MHLKKISINDITIPSKIFDYMTTSLPIIYGVDGIAKEILDNGKSGIYFTPGDNRSFVYAIRKLKENYNFYLGNIAFRKNYALLNYDRRISALKLIKLFHLVLKHNA